MCCELLEKFLLRSIKNNYNKVCKYTYFVVNCLKSFYFAVSKTTYMDGKVYENSCELLEKFLLRSIKNNFFNCIDFEY